VSASVEWRPPTPDDLPGIAALAAASDAHQGALEATLVDELASRLTWDRGIDAVSRVVTAGSQVVGAGWARIMATAGMRNWRVLISAFAAPGHAALYGELVRWLDAAAATDLGPGDVARIERVLTPSTAALAADVVVLYESLGYEFFYVEHEMSCDVASPPTPSDSDGIAIVPWTSARHAEIRDAYNDAFRERGFEGYQPEDWADAYHPDDFLPELSFVALDADRVVGFTLCTVLDDPDEWTDPAIRGAGWIDTVGVRPSHQGRGVASGLVARALDALRASGVDRAVLRVNEDNGRAKGVYGALGFVIVRQHVVYRKAG
jgi:ribosomal protein S18 acetylase RimI-like enzyme